MTMKIKMLKLLSSFCFVMPAALSFIHTLIYSAEYCLRDFVILVIFSLPLIINKRIFYLCYGLIAAIISLLVIFFYAFNNTLNQKDNSLIFFLVGIFFYLLIFSSSLTMVYIGTYSKEKGKFKLI